VKSFGSCCRISSAPRAIDMGLETCRSREGQQSHEGLPCGQDLLSHSRNRAPLGTGSRRHPCPTPVVSRWHRAHARVVDASSDSASQEGDAQTAGVLDGLVGALALHPKVRTDAGTAGRVEWTTALADRWAEMGPRQKRRLQWQELWRMGLVGCQRGMRPEATMISSSSSIGDRRAFAGVLMKLSGSWCHKRRRVTRHIPRDEDVRS
jgi:hypothetical protein